MAASSAATAKWAKRARMGSPSRSATERSAMSMAAAPSVICEEFPAVMSGAVSGSQVWAGARAGQRLHRPASADPLVGLERLAGEGAVLVLDRHRRWPPGRSGPLSQASAARRWLSSEKASMSSRVIPHRSASTWATRNCAHSRPSMCSRKDGGKGPVPPRAFEASGTRLIDSTPQATARS